MIRKINPKKLLGRVERALKDSDIKRIPLSHKMRVTEIVLKICRLKKGFGMFIILGWRKKWWRKYAGVPDETQDIFWRHHLNIYQESIKIQRTVSFDGAILINRKGEIIDSGIMIEGLRPTKTAFKVNPGGKNNDLSKKFGFKRKIHMRHLSAISASYELKNTTIFTISEETGDFHIFEKGRIIFSTVKKEGYEVDATFP